MLGASVSNGFHPASARMPRLLPTVFHPKLFLAVTEQLMVPPSFVLTTV